MAGMSDPSFWDQMLAKMGLGGNAGYQGDGVTTYAAPASQPIMAGGDMGIQVGGATPGVQGLPPVAGAEAGGMFGTPFGFNVGTGLTALGGLSALSNLYGANKAQKLASDQFKFTKQVTNTNLNNQIKSYNTSLADRLNARGAMQGDSAAATQAEIDKNRLTR